MPRLRPLLLTPCRASWRWCDASRKPRRLEPRQGGAWAPHAQQIHTARRIMAYSEAVRNSYQTEIQGIRAAGLFKEERYIHSPQSAEIEVEFPVGTEIKKCINICANNYLGL